ncbi:putative alpha-1,2-mannosidase [Haloferula luteola]|uniref:Putative alpha-1,2-mannosidase n=1 Tax=Haloferula luteola TaxID=595692 RepID=A0A840VEA5_9BACT|nr:GH92 family glycosyl hydrolase [Haloferula luteola]MBB5352968.1 putative alpha-1,2-mannosidase [Haloferula luteola]
MYPTQATLMFPSSRQRLLTTALLFAGIAPLAAVDFQASFEDGETPKALENQAEHASGGQAIQKNVQGRVPNALMKSIAKVTASAENPPNETAERAADDDGGSKWLAFRPNGWIQYELSEPGEAVAYTLTSGNDHAERDPRDWKVLGSDDGKDWKELDARSGESWGPRQRGQTKRFTLRSPKRYRFYQLKIDSIQEGDRFQLASWDLIPKESSMAKASPMTTEIGSGPSSGYNIKPMVGWDGVKAMRYAGRHTGEGRGYAMNRLFDVKIPVGKNARLSYQIFPELTGNDLQYPSTFTALNLRFTDGTQLSSLDPVDAYEISATAHGQGAGKVLYPNQWNNVRIDLGSLAEGKTIEAIQISYDNGGASETTEFQGWIDDIKIEQEPARIDGSSLTHYVDTRRGTNSSGAFSRGSNEAITCVPNGFNFLVPVTNAGASSREYAWQSDNDAQNRTRLEGLAVSHQPSPWMGDRNQFSMMPVAGGETPPGGHHARAVPFDHDDEVAQPDYYGVDLSNQVKAEMTPTNRGMIFRFTFPGDAGSVVMDTPTGDGEMTIDPATGRVTGWVDHGAGFRVGQSRMFLAGKFDRVPKSTGLAPGGRALTKYATFDTTGDKVVTVRVATSLISLEQAEKNLAMEVGEKSFDEVREEARKEWNERLGVVEVEGASETELVSLYSCLYRLNVYPNVHFENVGTEEKPDFRYASPVSRPVERSTAEKTGAEIVSGRMYVNNGFWDTYRTAWPAYALLYPEIAADLIDGFVDQYRAGGWIARWSSPGYANIMTGTSSDVAFADAYLRGVPLKDPLATYDAAMKNATVPSDNQSVGRKGLTTSLFLGYSSAREHESVSWATEGYINDFGIGNMAAALAEDPATPEERRSILREESAYLLERALNYVNLFDPAIGFFQARNADGTFAVSPENYDPTKWFGPYTETNGWNFSYHAPHDPNGLANLYGGRAGLEKKMDVFFSTPETSLGPIHEEVEARDARFGQWGVSNQVSHHVPFIYNGAGAPAKSQKIVREALQRSFTGSEIGQGYAGDEDNGEMSAWYLFNALGLYPLQVGSDQLVIGSPLYEKATVHLSNGKELVISAPGNDSSTVYIQSLKVDGKPYASTSIDSSMFQEGGKLEFVLGAKPSRWGAAPEEAPPSLTEGGEVARPLSDILNLGEARVQIGDGQDAAALFDNSSATEVTVGEGTGEVTIELPSDEHVATFYTLTAGREEADPVSWKLEGSQNGNLWSEIDSRSGRVFAHRRQTLPMQIQKPGAFRQYRLSMTRPDGKIVLSEIELLAKSAARPPAAR